MCGTDCALSIGIEIVHSTNSAPVTVPSDYTSTMVSKPLTERSEISKYRDNATDVLLVVTSFRSSLYSPSMFPDLDSLLHCLTQERVLFLTRISWEKDNILLQNMFFA